MNSVDDKHHRPQIRYIPLQAAYDPLGNSQVTDPRYSCVKYQSGGLCILTDFALLDPSNWRVFAWKFSDWFLEAKNTNLPSPSASGLLQPSENIARPIHDARIVSLQSESQHSYSDEPTDSQYTGTIVSPCGGPLYSEQQVQSNLQQKKHTTSAPCEYQECPTTKANTEPNWLYNRPGFGLDDKSYIPGCSYTTAATVTDSKDTHMYSHGSKHQDYRYQHPQMGTDDKYPAFSSNAGQSGVQNVDKGYKSNREVTLNVKSDQYRSRKEPTNYSQNSFGKNANDRKRTFPQREHESKGKRNKKQKPEEHKSTFETSLESTEKRNSSPFLPSSVHINSMKGSEMPHYALHAGWGGWVSGQYSHTPYYKYTELANELLKQTTTRLEMACVKLRPFQMRQYNFPDEAIFKNKALLRLNFCYYWDDNKHSFLPFVNILSHNSNRNNSNSATRMHTLTYILQEMLSELRNLTDYHSDPGKSEMKRISVILPCDVLSAEKGYHRSTQTVIPKGNYSKFGKQYQSHSRYYNQSQYERRTSKDNSSHDPANYEDGGKVKQSPDRSSQWSYNSPLNCSYDSASASKSKYGNFGWNRRSSY